MEEILKMLSSAIAEAGSVEGSPAGNVAGAVGCGVVDLDIFTACRALGALPFLVSVVYVETNLSVRPF